MTSKRERLLALAKAIEEPLFDDMGGWVGGYEVGIATAKGYVVKNIQDGTCVPVGPLIVPKRLHRRLAALVELGLDEVESALDELEEERDESSDLEMLDAVAMVKAGCKPGRRYFKLALAPVESLEEVWASVDGLTRPTMDV